MAKTRSGGWHPWSGGRYWADSEGKRTYYIRKSVRGTRYAFNTGATSERAAHAHLERFLANPESYDPRGDQRAESIYLDNALALDFLAWSIKPKKDGGAGNTARWVGQQRLYLATWMEKLRGIDLRRASLDDHIEPALEGCTCRPQRIAVIKRVYSWLRKVRTPKIKAFEDPTLATLSVPRSEPSKRNRVVPADHLKIVLEHLGSARWRDLLTLQLGTAMHVSEAERFSQDGTLEPLPRDGRAEGAAGAVAIPTTKAGDPLRVAVSAEVLAAAQRVLDAGPFDRAKYAKAIASACRAAGIPTFGPGSIRHTVLSHAVDAGASVGEVAGFAGHKSPRTTRRFYARAVTPRRVPTPM